MKRGIITINNGMVGISTTPVWMMQEEIADLFNVYGHDVCKAINAIYEDDTLSESETKRYLRFDEQRSIDTYSIEMIIAVAFRINSRESEIFRRLYYKSALSEERLPDCSIRKRI